MSLALKGPQVRLKALWVRMPNTLSELGQEVLPRKDVATSNTELVLFSVLWSVRLSNGSGGKAYTGHLAKGELVHPVLMNWLALRGRGRCCACGKEIDSGCGHCLESISTIWFCTLGRCTALKLANWGEDH